MIHDSIEWRSERDKNFSKWFCNDQSAYDFAIQITRVLETWDDLIDKDREVKDSEINNAFIIALYSLNTNGFFRKNVDYLLPLFMLITNSWLDANDMQTSQTKEERMRSFYLGQIVVELYTQIAFLTGGYEHMRNFSKSIRNFVNTDQYADWEHKL